MHSFTFARYFLTLISGFYIRLRFPEISFFSLKNSFGIFQIIKFQDDRLWFQIKLPAIGAIRFNPVVTVLSLTLIWSLIILCISKEGDVPFTSWRGALTENFTWWYITAYNLYLICAVMIYFRYLDNIDIHLKCFRKLVMRRKILVCNQRIAFLQQVFRYKTRWPE